MGVAWPDSISITKSKLHDKRSDSSYIYIIFISYTKHVHYCRRSEPTSPLNSLSLYFPGRTGKIPTLCSYNNKDANTSPVILDDTKAENGRRTILGIKDVDAQNGPANIESNLVIRCARSSAGKRAEALGETRWEVKVRALHKVPMWDLCKPLWWRHVSWRLGLATGSFGRCLAPRKCVFLRHRRRRGCLGASRFDAGSARFITV
ncbi:hypothetical protein L3X38_028094 [Prunus dulcis]|uniref:Uncharacterized protein n=1 Tax=Prunus dulcis TaxID=3755 RepID=A0AAD4VRS7_PRUDU|nr:hypothetical protein L3X38_028094 [Prunus dulcis]